MTVLSASAVSSDAIGGRGAPGAPSPDGGGDAPRRSRRALQPQRRATPQQVRRHSRRVAWMRRGFAALAVLSVGVFGAFLVASAVERGGERVVEISSAEAPAMVNPRFSGRDATGALFELNADTARTRRGDEGVIDLVDPRMTDPDGTVVRAPEGVFDRARGILDLAGRVDVAEAGGYTFVTEAARMFVESGRIEGRTPLTGSGPLGDIQADNFEILDGGDQVRLSGNVRTVLYPDGDRDAAPGQGPGPAPRFPPRNPQSEGAAPAPPRPGPSP